MVVKKTDKIKSKIGRFPRSICFNLEKSCYKIKKFGVNHKIYKKIYTLIHANIYLSDSDIRESKWNPHLCIKDIHIDTYT